MQLTDSWVVTLAFFHGKNQERQYTDNQSQLMTFSS